MNALSRIRLLAPLSCDLCDLGCAGSADVTGGGIERESSPMVTDTSLEIVPGKTRLHILARDSPFIDAGLKSVGMPLARRIRSPPFEIKRNAGRHRLTRSRLSAFRLLPAIPAAPALPPKSSDPQLCDCIFSIFVLDFRNRTRSPPNSL